MRKRRIATAQPPAREYDARRRVEDAINEYAKAHASWCMHTAHLTLVDKMYDAMMDALDAYAKDSGVESDDGDDAA